MTSAEAPRKDIDMGSKITDFDLDEQQVQSLSLRYFAGVKVETDGCWSWRGQHNADGYGYLCMFSKTLFAHRVAYFLSHGFWADPQTRHLCHNPGCVNPAHLIQGTHQQNSDDRKALLAGLDLLELVK